MKKIDTIDKLSADQRFFRWFSIRLKPSSSKRNRSGATLIEAILAVTIFAAFMTGTSKVLVSQKKVLDMARDHYTAANLAKNRMELLRTFDFNQIPALNETAIRIDNNGIPSTEGHFIRTTTINTITTNLYEMAITVKIQNRKTLAFDTAEQTINTYVAKHL